MPGEKSPGYFFIFITRAVKRCRGNRQPVWLTVVVRQRGANNKNCLKDIAAKRAIY